MSLGRLLASGKSLIGVKDTDSPYRMGAGNPLPRFGPIKNPFTVTASEKEAGAASSPVPVATGRAMPTPSVVNSPFSSAAAIPAREPAPAVESPVMSPEPAQLRVPAAPQLRPPGEPRAADLESIAGNAVRERRTVATPASVRAVAASVVAGHPMGPAPRRTREGVAIHSCSPLSAFVPAGNVSPRRGSWLGNWVQKLNLFRALAAWQSRRRSAGSAPVQAELSLEHVTVARNDLQEADLEVRAGRLESSASSPLPGLVKPGRGAGRRLGKGPRNPT